jgi:hypothetical protein
MAGMKYRKLRIAWSVCWGVACLLLIALWVRSYWANDRLRGMCPGAGLLHLDSTCGVFTLNVLINSTGPKFSWDSRAPRNLDHKWWFRYYPAVSFPWYYMAAPHWCFVLIAGLMAVGGTFRASWRFSLRTLLIVMTVAAIGLGWIVYAMRK